MVKRYSKGSLSNEIALKPSETLSYADTFPQFHQLPYNWNGFLRETKAEFFDISKEQVKALKRCQELIGSSFFENAGVRHISPAQMTALFSKIEKRMNSAFESWYYGKDVDRNIEIRVRVKRKSQETLAAEDAPKRSQGYQWKNGRALETR